MRSLFLICFCILYGTTASGQDFGFQLDSLQSLHKQLAEEGEYQQAVTILQQYNDLAFRTQNLKDSLTVLEMRETYQLDLQAKEIELQKAKIVTTQKQVLLGLILGVLMILSALVIRGMIRSKIKKEAEFFEQVKKRSTLETALTEEKLHQHIEENQQLEGLIALKNQHLSYQVLQLLKKNQFLQQVQQHLHTFSDQGELYNQIRQDLQSYYQPEEDWAAFLEQFEMVYPDFFPQLHQRSDRLTQKDLRLCALVRLQLSGKEIASLLGMEPESIKTARYRLSKKLGLEKDQKLPNILMQLG